MPIYVTVYHPDKTIIGKTEGDVTLADIEGYLDDLVKAKAHIEKRDNVGPFAVVTGGNREGRLADICQTISTADRPTPASGYYVLSFSSRSRG